MIDLRNAHNIGLARLRDTDSLRNELSKHALRNVLLESKEDGERVSLQLGGGKALLVSRGKANGRKGAAASEGSAFLAVAAPQWLTDLGRSYAGPTVLLDGELVVPGVSSANLVARNDNAEAREFVAFDCIWYGAEDLREWPLIVRRTHLARALAAAPHPKLRPIEGETVTLRNEAALDRELDRIRAAQIEGRVVKSLDDVYGATIGWKVKPVDTVDAVVSGYTEGKSWHLGAATRTGRVGSLTVTMLRGGVPVEVAMVPAGQLEVSLAKAPGLLGRVVEFRHRGWNVATQSFRFPTLVRLRTDKPAGECTMAVAA